MFVVWVSTAQTRVTPRQSFIFSELRAWCVRTLPRIRVSEGACS